MLSAALRNGPPNSAAARQRSLSHARSFVVLAVTGPPVKLRLPSREERFSHLAGFSNGATAE
jgi:hypothetical protein